MHKQMSEIIEGGEAEKHVETVCGFNIPLRELTEEEATREVTLERFQQFHSEAQEDFVDGFPHVNIKVFGGYMMAKHPELSTELLKIINDKYGEALSVEHLFEEEFDDDQNDQFYSELADFINLTGNLKKMVNQVLIQVSEAYAD